jgi:hypothetical protein
MAHRTGRSVALAVIVAAVGMVALGGCASTSIRSQISPDFRGDPYRKVMVWIDVDDEMLVQSAEDYLVEELDVRGVDAVAHYAVFFGGKEYTFDERKRELNARGVDAVLTIVLTDAGATRHRVPPTPYTVRRVNPYSGRVHHATRWTGGYVDVDAWADFKAELLDRESGEIVWRAFAKTSGDQSVGRVAFLQSVSREVTASLVKDRVVSK